jgi:hypothetical protein
MAGILRLDSVLTQDGVSGIVLNAATQTTQLQAAGFTLNPTITAITPTGKTKASYTFSASDQSFVVPAGVNFILVKLWGSGGGGGNQGGWTFGSWGGGGGFTTGIVPVTPGETLIIRVPRGGFSTPGATNAPFGGGSSTAGGDNQYGAGGGGYCGVFRSTTPLLIAGAGGGGGSILSSQTMCNGGAGGGLVGLRGSSRVNEPLLAGGGGTQSAGGVGGNGNVNAGQAGSSLQGGSVIGNPYGGGGGGGYFGGGAGSYSNSNSMGGGGGGSGFIATSVIYGASFPGNGASPAGTQDPDYPASTASTTSSVGFGGVQNNNGGDGHCVLYY